MREPIRNYAYLGPTTPNRRYFKSAGQPYNGVAVGIIKIGASRLPFFPGNVSNATTFDFPVRYLCCPGTTQENIHTGDETLIPTLIETAQQLEREGCRVIFASCGYFGHFQDIVARSVNIPVYLSSVIQIPWITVGLRPEQKVGVICSDAKNLNEHLFTACNVTKKDIDRCIIVGAQNSPEFSKIMNDEGNIDPRILEEEIVELATKLVNDNPEIGAIFLECTEMPPYAAAVQAAVNLPVYDFVTMIKYIHNTVAQKPYYGFM